MLRPVAWANELIKIWRNYGLAAGHSEFPISVPDLVTSYVNQRFADEQVVFATETFDSIEGALIRAGDGWCIVVNQAIDHDGRKNFTRAHELGHYLCHRQLQEEFKCDERDMQDYGGTKSIVIEREANEFAACLLMPLDDFRKVVNDKRLNVELISSCVDRYRTSHTSAAIQCMKISDRRAVVIKSRRGIVLWSKSSTPAFKAGIYFRKGEKIPDGSVTNMCLSDGNSDEACRGTHTNVWNSNSNVYESSFYTPKYDFSFTMLEYQNAPRFEVDEEPAEDMVDFYQKFSER